ncbi:hypothetical protein KW850_23280 [Bacillus sp. sid0103]|uniref:HesB/YadR/YfhF family protein n=1 Tax=Bacillus sp. sid0103 TaxID=2856337 RepID=UPI001C466A38|nr:hypothetical protein [Bacillus sp. sid0103]MBV7508146.1 hypothetical protein [Bacillus sp. sid0103]
MFMFVDEKAATWFTKEFAINKPFFIRMFPQYAGFGIKHKGFSLAFSAESPVHVGYSYEINGITFFVEVNDVWFFEDTEVTLTIDENLDEILVRYQELTTLAVN